MIEAYLSLFMRTAIITAGCTVGVISGLSVLLLMWVFWQSGKKGKVN